MAYEETRSPESIEIEKNSVEREKYDLEQWKLRAPHELTMNKICYIGDEQAITRKHIDTLISLRKTFSGDGKNTELSGAVDKQLLKFVNSLQATNLTAVLAAELRIV
jgi:hypothetical protein